MENKIIIEAEIGAPRDEVWGAYTEPSSIVKWNAASPDWHCPRAENDLRIGGRFDYRMEARDGSFGFDLTGTYTEVVPPEKLAYTLDDGRQVAVGFQPAGEGTKVTIAFEPESENPIDFQRAGWQAILDNFKKYCEERAEE